LTGSVNLLRNENENTHRNALISVKFLGFDSSAMGI